MDKNENVLIYNNNDIESYQKYLIDLTNLGYNDLVYPWQGNANSSVAQSSGLF